MRTTIIAFLFFLYFFQYSCHGVEYYSGEYGEGSEC